MNEGRAHTYFFAGVVKSPNYPRTYPNNLNKTDKVVVREGMILSIEFEAFDVHRYSSGPDPCTEDHLRIVDGDGTILLQKTCGTSLPTSFRSRSNLVNIFFFTDSSDATNGWKMKWSATTQGD